MSEFPTLFVSHGAPLLAVTEGPAHSFLRGLGDQLGKPSAIVVASAHWETQTPSVTAAAMPRTIHDFGGFPRELYALRYPAPGSAQIASRIVELLQQQGVDGAASDTDRGLDHGAWVPLLLMYPDADVPVLQISLRHLHGMQAHFALGRALSALKSEGVLIMGSGSATHNLMEIGRYSPDEPPPSHVHEFNEWLAQHVEAGDWNEIEHYRSRAPHAVRNHPTEEHFVPLAVAWGAASAQSKGRRIHASYTYGSLSMDAYLFQ